MSVEAHNDGSKPRPRLQFSLLALLGFVTLCNVVLGLVAWMGASLAAAVFLTGGFCLVLVGSGLRQDRVVTWGGICMLTACAVLVPYAFTQITFR